MPLIKYYRRPLRRLDTPARLADLADNEFEGYASLFGVPDASGDVVARGAFAASLRRRPPGEVRMLYQHLALEPIGVWTAIKEDARGLYVRGRLVLDVERARDVRALIRDGALNGLSIGFRTVRAARDAAGHRLLTEIELWEISVVTFPLLAQSLVTAVGGKSAPLADTLRRATHDLRHQTRLSSPAPEAREASFGREGDPGLHVRTTSQESPALPLSKSESVAPPGSPSPRIRADARLLGRG